MPRPPVKGTVKRTLDLGEEFFGWAEKEVQNKSENLTRSAVPDDDWFVEQVCENAVQHILDGESLGRLVRYKHGRGKSRPRNEALARSNNSAEVKKALALAATSLDSDSAVALKSLTSLRGVGPATASYLLAAMSEHIAPMSDEALQALLGRLDYTHTAFQQLQSAAAPLAQRLGVTARTLERLLWNYSRNSARTD